MPPQDQAPVKDVDLEPMSMNLKKEDRCVVNHGEDLTAVDFGGDVSLVEKEQTILLEPSSTVRLDRTIMPPQDQAPVKDVDLEAMLMNLKEGHRCIVIRGEDLTEVDFGGDVSLAEKEGASMAGSWRDTEQAQQNGWSISCRWTKKERIEALDLERDGPRS
ncbi:hypothetical protein BHE74_00044833 [Ensete ventricosum]|nr:hypothetical protein GW17_00045511 [Ensete ventricosum]RWW49046.1 hypothetical protein BHE74_00044833 [Ensete ventricosum]